MTSCGWLAPPLNGHKEGISYLAGSTVHFHCDSGYNLFGAEASTCQADGTWSRPSPMCQPGEGARPTCLSPHPTSPASALTPLPCFQLGAMRSY